MGSSREVRCSECGSQVVDSNSERGYKFCPECKTTRSRRDVDIIYTHCQCCKEAIDQSPESQETRERLYEESLEEYVEEELDEEPDSAIEEMISANKIQAFKSDISADRMCVNCLEAGCSLQISSCTYRMEKTDPEECDHSFFTVSFGEYDEECRWCGLKR